MGTTVIRDVPVHMTLGQVIDALEDIAENDRITTVKARHLERLSAALDRLRERRGERAAERRQRLERLSAALDRLRERRGERAAERRQQADSKG